MQDRLMNLYVLSLFLPFIPFMLLVNPKCWRRGREVPAMARRHRYGFHTLR
jgi:hypothetical protein